MVPAEEFRYVGNELAAFATAINWKSYWASFVVPEIKGRVLEVGAGNGNNTGFLTPKCKFNQWIALEPDARLAGEIAKSAAVQVHRGDLSSIERTEQFDTILYLDVLEHIENDRQEITSAVERMESAARLIVLAPAHAWLFSAFDHAIGHYRRYDKPSLRNLMKGLPLAERKLIYLDSASMPLSFINRVSGVKSLASRGDSVRLWDGFFVPVSKVLDRLSQHRLGKSVLGIWEKTSVSVDEES